jgi:dipeptidyl-peptidase 4
MMRASVRPAVRAALIVLLVQTAAAQDRLKTLPGYEQFQRVGVHVTSSVKSGALSGVWKDEGKAFEFVRDGHLFRYDIAARNLSDLGEASEEPRRPGTGRGGQGAQGGLPARGRQFEWTVSPDERLKAFYRDRNLWVSAADGSNEVAVTTDGSDAARVKYATASWVYGEELGQRSAMWWSPDSTKVAYYRFDESPVPDYHLQIDQTKLQSRDDVEAYPKAGAPNPVVDLFVYDVAAKKSVRIDVRDGKPFDNAVVGHYVYRVQWSPDGRELLFHRMNRRQNILELAAADPATGACRLVVREEWPASWVEDGPDLRFLKDGRRFVWSSERNGWKNYYLYDLSGRLIAPLTRHATFEAAAIVAIDDAAGLLYYTARDGDNALKLQLHRVKLDGSGDRRLTDPALTHVITASPDAKHFVDIAQAHDIPPVTRLIDGAGTIVAQLAKSDTSRFDRLALKKVELFTYKAADGQTDLYGMLHKPSNFDPSRKYPLLISVYAGPATSGARETFTLPNALTEYGFLVASLDSRSASGRGKKALDVIYQRLGTVEIDDQAAGVRALRERPYVDGHRVGVFGTSYGGYASLMCLLRYPDVFQAASASSPVTAWNHYDSIYTERYMWIPQENKAGYDAGSAMTYADRLTGRLLIYYGTADNNVHPSNSMQLIQALQKAGKSFDVQVGPDMGHSGVRQERMMEFFIENLVLRPVTAGTGS